MVPEKIKDLLVYQVPEKTKDFLVYQVPEKTKDLLVNHGGVVAPSSQLMSPYLDVTKTFWCTRYPTTTSFTW